jgi:hypothetical protein
LAALSTLLNHDGEPEDEESQNLPGFDARREVAGGWKMTELRGQPTRRHV